jgi:hypothetical protein
MPHGPTFDDGEIDAILAGSARDGDLAPLTSFVADVRSAGGAVPTPSAVLAAALASGISPEAPATVATQPLWRKFKMKTRALVAGLGVAGKIALGAGVAVAATTGAGAAGVLPGPFQHAFATAVDTVTPFHVSDGEHHTSDHEFAGGTTDGTTTTTMVDTTSTTKPGEHEHHAGDGDNQAIVTPTTGHHDFVTTTSAPGHEASNGDNNSGAANRQGDNQQGGDQQGAGNNHETTPTTEHHESSGGDGGDHHEAPSTTTTTEHHENHNPQSIVLSCTRGREPNHVSCSWTASTNPEHQKYVLLRVSADSDHGQVVDQTGDGLSYNDTTVTVGHSYAYSIVSLRADGSVESHSNVVTIFCCGD